MSSEIIIPNAEVRIVLPSPLDVYEQCEIRCNPYEGQLRIRTFLEISGVRVRVPEVGTGSGSGSRILTISNLRLRELTGDLIPVYCKSSSKYHVYSVEEE